MKKSDLVVGEHFVQHRNGHIALLMYRGDELEFIDKYGYLCSFTEYTNELTNKDGEEKYDIIKVGVYSFTGNLFENINWIWERVEMKYNVGDIVEDLDGGFWKIREKHNGYYNVDCVTEYGCFKFKGYSRWYDDDFVGYAKLKPKLVKEMTVEEIEKALGYQVKIVKEETE